ncbi:MAG: hypothetical protein ACTSYL_07780 [Candidatus Thorarchaeota archaeon]
MIVDDTTSPVITGPDDFSYTYGTTGHNISWTIVELYPHSYQVYQNGSVINSRQWFENYVNISVDDLDVGVYNFTIVFADTSGNVGYDTVIVTVVSESTTTTTETTTTTPTPPPPPDMTMVLVAVAGVVVILVIVFIIRPKKSV